MKKLAVIIINYNTPDMTEKAIRNFLVMENNLEKEILIIDNNSKDKVDPNKLTELGVKLIFNTENLGFAKAVNQGIKNTESEFLLLLNSDVLVEKNAISHLLSFMEKNRKVGIIGPMMIFPDGRFQPSFGNLPTLWREFLRFSHLYKIFPGGTVTFDTKFDPVDKSREQAVEWITGGCMLIRREMLNEIGLFDENYFLGVEDMDICNRAKKVGWQVIYFPLSKVIHYHGYSSGGTRSVFRIEQDRNGFLYFFKKFHPQKVFSRFMIRLFHDAKIIFIKLLNKVYMKNKTYIPIDATIAITYQCNSRCQMCNIWQNPKPASLPQSAFSNLSPHLRYVNLSGGEPFLRSDLPEIVDLVKKASPKAQIIISSNGLAAELILESTKKILAVDPSIGIRISIDGDKETHEQVRGVPGIYGRAMNTIDGLKKLGVKNLGISFTVMDKNASKIKEVYNFSKKNDLQFALALVQNSEIYFNKKDNAISKFELVEKGLDHIVFEELKSLNPKKWLRAFYDYGLKYYAAEKKRLLPSGAGFDSLFIDAHGHIFPSNLINLKMGNIAETKLDETWNAPEANAVRRDIIEKKISESWIICTIRGEMRRHPFKVLSWVGWNKFRTILGAKTF